MRKSWAMAVSVALAGCGAEFAAARETIVDGGEDAVELEGGISQATSGGGATRVTSATIVSAHPRPARVPEATPMPAPSAAHIAEVLDAPASSVRAGMEVAAAWTLAGQVNQLVGSGEVVAWGSGNQFFVASSRDGAIVKTRALTGCVAPI